MGEFLCGKFERYCYDKYDEYYEKGGILNKAKAIGFAVLRGFPAGLAFCGIILYLMDGIAWIQGKKLGLVDKDS